jgi:hypothetical protein
MIIDRVHVPGTRRRARRVFTVAVLLLPLAGPTAATMEAPLMRAEGATAKLPFIIGAEGRFDGADDRIERRTFAAADAVIDASVEVDVVADGTWLRQELASYAQRALRCDPADVRRCRRELRGAATSRVLFLAVGARAEIVWVSGENRAVRLTWRRVVETPSGTMTVDAPPARAAAVTLSEFPSRLGADLVAPSADAELERLLYYVEQAMNDLSSGRRGDPRPAVQFVTTNLDRTRRLAAGGAELVDDCACTRMSDDAALRALPPDTANALVALRHWRSAADSRLCTTPAAASRSSRS